MIHKDTVTSPSFRAYDFNPSVKLGGTWLYLIKYFKCKTYIHLIQEHLDGTVVGVMLLTLKAHMTLLTELVLLWTELIRRK